MHFKVEGATVRCLDELAAFGIDVPLDVELDFGSARDASPRDVERALAEVDDLAVSFESSGGHWHAHALAPFHCCPAASYAGFYFRGLRGLDQQMPLECHGNSPATLFGILVALARRTGPLILRPRGNRPPILVHEDSDPSEFDIPWPEQ